MCSLSKSSFKKGIPLHFHVSKRCLDNVYHCQHDHVLMMTDLNLSGTSGTLGVMVPRLSAATPTRISSGPNRTLVETSFLDAYRLQTFECPPAPHHEHPVRFAPSAKRRQPPSSITMGYLAQFLLLALRVFCRSRAQFCQKLSKKGRVDGFMC